MTVQQVTGQHERALADNARGDGIRATTVRNHIGHVSTKPNAHGKFEAMV